VDVPADCHATTCDGHGHSQSKVDVTNVPPAAHACVVGACDMLGNAGQMPALPGTACTSSSGGTLCDGEGNCVACLTSTDCRGGQGCSPTHTCIPASCNDGIQDGNETGVDCGGSCAPCSGGNGCRQGGDCASNVCDLATHTCAAPSCADGIKNGNES